MKVAEKIEIFETLNEDTDIGELVVDLIEVAERRLRGIVTPVDAIVLRNQLINNYIINIRNEKGVFLYQNKDDFKEWLNMKVLEVATSYRSGGSHVIPM